MRHVEDTRDLDIRSFNEAPTTGRAVGRRRRRRRCQRRRRPRRHRSPRRPTARRRVCRWRRVSIPGRVRGPRAQAIPGENKKVPYGTCILCGTVPTAVCAHGSAGGPAGASIEPSPCGVTYVYVCSGWVSLDVAALAIDSHWSIHSIRHSHSNCSATRSRTGEAVEYF